MSHCMTALRVLVLAAAAAIAAPALADKPEWAGGGKDKHESKHKGNGDSHGRGGKHGDQPAGKHQGQRAARQEVRVGGYFSDQHRQVARTSYAREYGGDARRCPPGLAKKNNGCMPPGQAKKYHLGQPLPSDIVYYPVPQPVLVHLPPAPAGHKYVRVAADILLIAVGSSMVIDAISDLGRL
jgi:Ni/Co efflux regulator RcnB